MNVTNLRSFLAVAESGGFTAAASRCGVSQPTLTRQVKELEERYGVMLFERTSRRVRLTGTGEQLLERARRAFEELDGADRFLRARRRQEIRIYSVRTERLSGLINLLSKRLNSPEIRVSIMPSALVYEGLVGGKCDLGFLTMPEDAGELDALEIGVYPLLAYVSERHSWRGAGSISLIELDGRPVVIGTRATQTRRTFDRETRRLGIEVSIVQEEDDFEVVLAMAEAGCGIGILGATGSTDPREVQGLRFREASMRQPLHLAIARASSRLPVADMALSAAREWIAPCAAPADPSAPRS